MREGQIFQMNQAQSQKVYGLFRAVANLDARVRALESVLVEMNSRIGFSSTDLIERVNKRHAEEIEKLNQAMAESNEKAKEEAKKPKLTIVPAGVPLKPLCLILCVLALSGCVTQRYSERSMDLAYKSGYQQANSECLSLQQRISGYIKQLESQLIYLGQLNEDGSIRTPDNDDSKAYDDR